MTLSNSSNTQSYTAAGTAQEVFDISFPFTDNTEIRLLEDGDLQVQGTDYTVTGAGTDTGGTATYVGTPTASATILITRVVPLTQNTDLLETGRFSAEAIEAALDKGTMVDQQSLQLDTTDGDTYDAQGRRIVDGADPEDDQDFATKVWVTGQITGAGDLPVPADPGDDGKGLLASGGAFATSTMELVPVPGASDLKKPLVANAAASGGYAYETTPAHGGRAQNLLLNGDFRVAQHGTSFTTASVPLNNNDTYLLDQWILLSEDTTDGVDVSQETTIVPDGAYASIKLDAESANSKFAIIQILEARDTARAMTSGNGKVSWSLEAYIPAGNQFISALRVGIVGWTGTADAPVSSLITSWAAAGTNPTLDTTSWDDVGTNGYLNTPANLTLVGDTWTTFTETDISTDSSITNLAMIIWVDDADAAIGDIVYISNVQLVIGDRVDTYGHRPMAEELALCQRYLQVFTADTIADPFAVGYTVNGTNFRSGLHFPTVMRSAPTLVVGSAASDFRLQEIGSTTAVATLSLTQATTAMAIMSGTLGSGGNAGEGNILEATNTNAKLTFSAEL